jgi:DNA repair photolyase
MPGSGVSTYLLLPVLSVEPEPLRGIAALAARAELIEELNQVEYREIEARSILTRCSSPRMPFTWTVNPYRGCEFGCQYCYARYAHEFMEKRDPLQFEREIFIKRRAAELLRNDLKKVRPDQSIAIGTATDPYQPAERRYKVTRSLLEVFADQRGLSMGIISKSNLIARDIDLFKRIAARNRLSIRLTITTVDTALARALEPRTPRPDLRLQAVRKLRNAGLATGVMCAPVLPGITDGPDQLETLVAACAAAGAQFFNANPLFLKPCAQAQFFPFLEKRLPDLAPKYREQYLENASAAYHRRISQTVERLNRKYGLQTSSHYELDGTVPADTQLALF